MLNRLHLTGLAIAIGTAVTLLSTRTGVARPDDAPATGFAVVELFGSEGCSSCPPADDALADLIKSSKNQRVYALAFHVDYWDDLGWPDPYADAAYTARQRAYGAAMKNDSVYTPQAIVNGKTEFVGSNRVKLKATVADALATPAAGTIAVQATRAGDDIRLDVTSTDLPAGTLLHAALVEDGLVSKVTRGENKGRSLPHEHVVRQFNTSKLDAGGAATLTLAPRAKIDLSKSSIVLFAQRGDDLHVLAATEVGVPR